MTGRDAGGPPPRASIIVVTRNRSSLLRDCLDALLADTSHIEREIVVVDNASDDDTAAVARAVAAAGPALAVRLVHEPTVGISPARNRGLAEARGSVLCFVDDDTRVDDGWADALTGAFADPAVGGAGGRILPVWPGDHPPWMGAIAQQQLALRDWGPTTHAMPDAEYPVGANMAYRRDVLPPGGFDTGLGYRGDLRVPGEETHLSDVVRARWTLLHVGDARVHHLIAPERVDRAWLRRETLHHGVGVERVERRRGVRPRRLPRRAAGLALTSWRARRATRRADRDPTPDHVDTELETWHWVGRRVEALVGRWPTLVERTLRRLG